MQEYQFIAQPPLASKYTFLVDDISISSNYGWVTDIQKINYNREILGETFNVDIKISLLMTEDIGSTFVFGLGYFIAVLQLKADQQEGRMTFYHCMINIPKGNLHEILCKRYCPHIALKWLEVHDFIHKNLSPERDIVRILKP